MVSIDITVPDELKAFAESEAAREGHASVSEYVTALLREAERRAAQSDLEAKLVRALDAPARELSERDWDAMDRDFERRHSEGKGR